ncbi:hypothetical protein Tco_1010233 [Tanacetum coccineum]
MMQFLNYNSLVKPRSTYGEPGHITIQSDFFFNKDLEYLRYGRKIAYLQSISKMKAAFLSRCQLRETDEALDYRVKEFNQQDKSRDEYKILDEERRCQKQGVHVRYPETAKDTTYLPESGELCWWTDSRRRLPRTGKYGDFDGYTSDDPILKLEILSRRFVLR